MKYIILAAGEGTDAFSLKDKNPKCLVKIDNKTVIDNILEIASLTDITDINIIGGFEILKIMKAYPNLKYFYNERWKSTKSLFSLFKSFSILNSNALISYADIVHKSETIEHIDKNKINIFYDSQWKNRYENRDMLNLEKIFDKHNTFLGEFSGLLYVPENEIGYIKELTQNVLEKDQSAILLNLIEKTIEDKDVNFIDVDGNWAELDSIQDIEHFKFGTKAETLKNLKLKVKNSQILSQHTFTVGQYKKNHHLVITNIQKKINAQLLVVRSSALGEDSHQSSMAGKYESILRIPKDNTTVLQEAIESVIESYTKNKQLQNDKNQVLVQAYLENVTMSGVVFSKDLQTASPYYIINYDESNDTESVTSGYGNNLNTFICYNHFESEIEKKELRLVVDAVKEIESITNFDAIDVEFAFVDEKLYILQVRPIAAKKDTLKVSVSDISNEIQNIKQFLEKNNPNLLTDEIAYGVMPDWNPAEIIGINPKALSLDLYRYIITDTIWAKSRKELGYADVENQAGLVSFAGKPYVDINMSFNTFIPADLDKKIAKKLIRYFIKKLRNSPHLHDKVEFDIAITAFDFDFETKLEELSKNGFNTDELEQIKLSYINLTQNIILQKSISIKQEIGKTLSLAKKREAILNSDIDDIDKIYNLLEDCKKYGTLAFSNLARFGFIGSILLKSLLGKKIITIDEYEAFLKSIHTVAKEFMNDYSLLLSKKLYKDEFLSRYAHLRPGTYDITSKTYREGFDEYIDSAYNKKIVDEKIDIFAFSKYTEDRIASEIEKNGLNFSVEQLLDFIVNATESREKAKFEFSKNLSAALELVAKIGTNHGLSRDDLSHLNLDILLKYKNSSSRIDFGQSIKQNIIYNRQKYLISSAIKLPELIFDTKDIEMFYYSPLKPNFISQQSVEGEIIEINGSNEISINDKIVLIQRADPGYDWIFSHNIKALVTKYGGVASHMAIRCAEFDLPAAIGCGESIYNNLLKNKKITLDCVNQTIKALS